MRKTIQIRQTGDCSRLQLVHEKEFVADPNETLVRQTHAGVNFVDVYHRTGLYPLASLPAVLGVEGAGFIERGAAGNGQLHEGARVAYAAPFPGAYATMRTIESPRLVELPDNVPNEIAGATMLRGITAYMLLEDICKVSAGSTVLVHAAAGGLGLILVQWARHLGATVIGTVGSREKAEIALAAGLNHAIVYREEDFVARVRDLTGGNGVDVAYDGIGSDTLIKTLDAVRQFGTLASIGQSAGPVRAIDIAEIGPGRSLSFMRPSSFAYMRDIERYRRAAQRYIALLSEGALKISIDSRYNLDDAAQAHTDMEGRRTTGPVVLEISSS